MSKADDSIRIIDGIICDNIQFHFQNNPGLMSQNILSQLRNFVESIVVKIFGSDDSDPNDYNEIQKNLKKLKESNKKYKFIKEFHESLQITESHYTLDKENSERLLDSYLQYLFKLRELIKKDYGIEILHDIERIQFINDPYSREYYEKVAKAIINHRPLSIEKNPTDRYYILNVKTFCAFGKLFYEITFVPVNSKISKFDRLIAYSDKEPMDNYSVVMTLVNDTIDILNMELSITIMESWMVWIRPCELVNYSKIFGDSISIDPGLDEYRVLMKHMTDTGNNLIDLLQYPDEKLSDLFNTRTKRIYSVLIKSRYIVNNRRYGSNVIRYMLYRLRNVVIKSQLTENPCAYFGGLFLSKRCIPFDKMPFCTSLVEHNPSLSDLVKCLDTAGREHELFARSITHISESEGSLFVKIDGDYGASIDKYNGMLYLPSHENRKLVLFNKHVYLYGRVKEIYQIIEKIKLLGGYYVEDYREKVENIIEKGIINIDCSTKKKIVSELFKDKSVAFIYGSAGTGKTTLIRYVSTIFSKWNKLFLSNTNSAVENLRQKVKDVNSTFMTVKQYCLKAGNNPELIIIDECSTISNEDILNVLDKSKEGILFLFVGDIYQLESIRFGNWFKILSSYVPKNAVYNLETIYRTDEKRLLDVWKSVRHNEDGILERLIKNGFSSEFDETIFERKNVDEIVLCLNYSGIYGINNINQILQMKNNSESITWGLNSYKIGDPVLFNESNRFNPIIHNNMKGIIRNIEKQDEKIIFDIEVESEIDIEYAILLGVEVTVVDSGRTRIKFDVKKYKERDSDGKTTDTVVPFNIAYAISIHKSQGLEYDSVKIVISDDVEDKITQNIFYTAITRAKKNLKIYWSKKTAKKVISDFKQNDINHEVQFINQIWNLDGKYHKIE